MLTGIKFFVTVCSHLVYSSTSKKEKKFFCFLPSHPHTCGSSALFIGVSEVRVSVRVSVLPSHYPHTSLFRQEALCLPGILWMGVRFNGQGAKKQRFTGSIAMVYCWCSYAALLVQLCWHCWYSYAGPLV